MAVAGRRLSLVRTVGWSLRFLRAQFRLRTLETNCETRFVSSVPFHKGHAKDLVYSLNAKERDLLFRELQAMQASHRTNPDGSHVPPTKEQLKAVALHNAMPFIGFGFLDNFIMIIAGDYIDLTIGMTLGISTLAAAGLGNLISDVAGIGSAWYVENISSRIGVMPPPLTPEQLGMHSTRWCAQLGRAIGISIGCLLGMIPLLFLKRHKKSKNKDEDQIRTDNTCASSTNIK